MSAKNVIIRVDFNVPVQNGKISDPTRILAIKETVEYFSIRRVILASHFRDPKKGENDYQQFSFAQILDELKHYLGRDILLLDLFDERLPQKIDDAPQEMLILLDNSRLWPGEKECSDELAQRIASLGSLFINEAFSCSHRAHASVIGVSKYLPTYPGFHFQSELRALTRGLKNPESPFLAIIGGSKISSKLPILESLLPKVDFLAIGGAMAHTFFAAYEKPIGCSLFEQNYVPKAKELLDIFSGKILLPRDVAIANDLDSPHKFVDASSIPSNFSAFDIGPITAKAWSDLAKCCNTVVWNGTLGVAEHPPFDAGSKEVSRAICDSKAFSLAGGGDTLAALAQFGVADKFSHVCTGGGAFLEWLAAGELLAEKTFTATSFDFDIVRL
ncbi:MAG: phosphoglycerate kinase [Holosporales bacterium]|jgi:phosphoglycerate kinase|nr:phosphoglycerate kinase [Holosporales bacterium]